jgi:CheY-like chemotaxis protein
MYPKIMVIDDNPIDRFVVEKVLTKHAFTTEVISMEGAQSALDYLTTPDNRASLPAIILLDINMPGINGFEFLELFDRLDESIKNNCRIIMLSSSMDKSDYDRSLSNSYVTNYINKPLVPDKLRELI